MKTLILVISGNAKEVFRLFALFCKAQGDKKIIELKEAQHGN